MKNDQALTAVTKSETELSPDQMAQNTKNPRRNGFFYPKIAPTPAI